ncbi:MAG: DoxX family protein [Akkermansiaceae bacterium]|nr:DoxX family protein [Akkermansiaceae bacterium]NNM29819.1 DoxX family protein [Akkermansiaceae bacterium]
METFRIILQIIVALGLLNVWILRAGKATSFRGRGAANMREEFKAYGLPPSFMLLVGALKIGVAVAFLAGIWFPALVRPAAVVLIVLMLGAIGMHVKVRDPLRRALPSLAMLVLATAIALL